MSSSARLPPRWFVVLAWKVHRALFRLTGGRRGLWPPRGRRWGALRLTTVGRRSGQERSVILGYLVDGYAGRRPTPTAVVVLEPTMRPG
jgi:F420H(2)-dependent quinone reductase